MDTNRTRHSYLPGVCLPVYPEDWLMQNNASASSSSNILIPILPVVSVFLFPGTQLPLRLRHKAWTDWISNAIRDIRKQNLTGQLRIGVCTLVRGRQDHSITLDEPRGLVGKTGVFATVTYTHEDDMNTEDSSDSNGRRVRGRIQEREIIMTVVGT